jgi:hypothetical protein
LPEGTELLLIDDASNDATFAVAKEAAAKWPIKSKTRLIWVTATTKSWGFDFFNCKGF